MIDKLGGVEFGRSVRTSDMDLTSLTAHVLLNYGVSPLFDVETTLDGKIGVSSDD